MGDGGKRSRGGSCPTPRSGHPDRTQPPLEKLNAFDERMAAALVEQLDFAAADPGCRCLTITGAGRGFCAGQSLSDGENGLPREIGDLVRSRYMPIITRMRDLPIPVVAEVNGVAAGAGFALALAADIRLASEHAWFSCAFSKIGLVPDSGASFFLPICGSLRESL